MIMEYRKGETFSSLGSISVVWPQSTSLCYEFGLISSWLDKDISSQCWLGRWLYNITLQGDCGAFGQVVVSILGLQILCTNQIVPSLLTLYFGCCLANEKLLVPEAVTPDTERFAWISMSEECFLIRVSGLCCGIHTIKIFISCDPIYQNVVKNGPHCALLHTLMDQYAFLFLTKKFELKPPTLGSVLDVKCCTWSRFKNRLGLKVSMASMWLL